MVVMKRTLEKAARSSLIRLMSCYKLEQNSQYDTEALLVETIKTQRNFKIAVWDCVR